jgi:hypothetical protein
MPKIALCISGQPRFVKECYANLHDTLLRPNGMPDVFIHTWWSEDLLKEPYKYGGAGGWEQQRIPATNVLDLKNLYNPVNMQIEPTKVWSIPNIDFRPNVERFRAMDEPNNPLVRIPSNSISMFQSIFKANLLRTYYEWENNFRYDYVIRIRSDLLFQREVRCDILDPTRLHVADLGQPADCVSDWITIGNSQNMTIFSNQFLEYQGILEKHFIPKGLGWTNENLSYEYLKERGIGWQLHPWMPIIPRF